MNKAYKYYYTNPLFDNAGFCALLRKYNVPAYPLADDSGLVFWIEPLKELAKHPDQMPIWIYNNLKWML